MTALFRLFTLCMFLGASAALAQGAQVAFGGLKHDRSLPIELTSDSLAIDQAQGTAVASGTVLAGQGSLRISADTLLVEYETQNGEPTGNIHRMTARGTVTLTNGAEAAEAQQAIYTVAEGRVVMTGDVILTQGKNALSGEKLLINLNDGTATIEGRVKTIFQPASQ